MSITKEDEFLKAFEQNEIPAPVLFAILEQRKRRQEELQEAWEGTFDEWREEFRSRLQQAVDEGLIPPNGNYDQRINDVRFFVADPLVLGTTVGRNLGGGFLAVQVEFREKTAIRKTVFHEMMHHVSGGVIQRTDTEVYDHDTLRWQSTTYAPRKNGLIFVANRGFLENGRWLNEGMTELLARQLADVEQVTSYPYEQRVIVDIIEKSDVSTELFINAYFEGHLARPENGSRLPAFRALNAAMTKAYGAGWLKKFGKMIQDAYDRLITEQVNNDEPDVAAAA